jgi:TonB family protein
MLRLLRAPMLAFSVLSADAASLRAQVLGGTIVDELSRRPRGYLAVEAFDSVTTVRDTTRKDGTFMLALPYGGTFSLRVYRDGADALVFPAQMIARDSMVQRVFPIAAGRAYFEFEVEHTAHSRASNAPLKYPESLRQQNVEGEVLAQFVVETSGHVREGSLKNLRSTHELFALSVELFLRTAEFTPATIRGFPVAQLVQQPFTFTLR